MPWIYHKRRILSSDGYYYPQHRILGVWFYYTFVDVYLGYRSLVKFKSREHAVSYVIGKIPTWQKATVTWEN